TPATRAIRAGVLSTGDELIEGPADASAPATPGRIRNSNGPMLRALVTEAGATPYDLGICRDEIAPLTAALERGIADHDLLIVCGGMSMGTRDHVPSLL